VSTHLERFSFHGAGHLGANIHGHDTRKLRETFVTIVRDVVMRAISLAGKR